MQQYAGAVLIVIGLFLVVLANHQVSHSRPCAGLQQASLVHVLCAGEQIQGKAATQGRRP